jgi:hypothetical protein
MNKVTRMLAIAGMALAAGATIGATPAMAASSTVGSPTTVTGQASPGDWIAGYYPSYRRCDRAGDLGEWSNRWDNHYCYRVPYGFHRGWFALSVGWDWNNDWNNGDHHHGGDNNHHGGDGNHHQGGDNNHHGGDNNHHGGGDNHHGGGDNHHDGGDNHHDGGDNHHDGDHHHNN